MDVTERVLEKASYLAEFVQAALMLLAIFILYAILIVCIVAVFIFVSVLATIIIFMPVAITVIIFIVVTEFISYFWRIAPGGDGLIINLYAGVGVNGDGGPDASSNGRGDADNGRGWLRWWLGWWWWVALVAVAAVFLLTEPV